MLYAPTKRLFRPSIFDLDTYAPFQPPWTARTQRYAKYRAYYAGTAYDSFSKYVAAQKLYAGTRFLLPLCWVVLSVASGSALVYGLETLRDGGLRLDLRALAGATAGGSAALALRTLVAADLPT